MNFDRFGFKAMDMRFDNVWIIATLRSRNGEAFEVEWNYEGKEKSFSVAWIKPETICQCTGLRDSDGKLIYENDFLKITGKDGTIEKALVRYDENILEYLLIFNESELPIRFFLMWMEEGKKCYVIGNKNDKEENNG